MIKANSAKLSISPGESIVLLLYCGIQAHNSIIVLSKSYYKMCEYKSYDPPWEYRPHPIYLIISKP